MIINVTTVEVIPDYQLKLEFDNGETRLFDFRNYLDYKCYETLKNIDNFNQARVFLGTVSWGNNIDIAPETLYEKSIKM